MNAPLEEWIGMGRIYGEINSLSSTISLVENSSNCRSGLDVGDLVVAALATQETVYKYRKYDIASDDYVCSSRYATMTQIYRIEAEPVSTGIKLATKYLMPEGWTAKNFDPAKVK